MLIVDFYCIVASSRWEQQNTCGIHSRSVSINMGYPIILDMIMVHLLQHVVLEGCLDYL